jgi:TerC family integral membrane protein
MSVPLWAYGAFAAFVALMLALDLLVFHRHQREVSLREAAWFSALWIALGLGFGLLIWWWQGPSQAGAYYAGYVVEKALSVDNVFVFALIFGYFATPARLQHRVLFWGVIGAIAMRVVFIAAGAALLGAFHWILYLFGAFLVYTGYRLARHRGHQIDPARNPALRLLRRVVPVSDEYAGGRFLLRRNGAVVATPLLAALVAVEASDLVFALDSIPAVFAITRDTFIIVTSNAFAILGLRALYFLLAGSMQRFAHLQTGLAVVLAFVGAKMLLTDVYHVPIAVSLAVIFGVLGVAVAASRGGAPAGRPQRPEAGSAHDARSG